MLKIKLYGLGGQGVVTASKLLVQAACIGDGRYAKNLPAYGAERRGAPIFADVMIDDQPILVNSFVYEPDMVVVFDPSVAAKGSDIGSGAGSQTVLLVNCRGSADLAPLAEVTCWKAIYSVDATGIALGALGRPIPNSAMLGALARAGVVQLTSIQDALRETFGQKAGEINVQSANQAYASTTRLR